MQSTHKQSPDDLLEVLLEDFIDVPTRLVDVPVGVRWVIFDALSN